MRKLCSGLVVLVLVIGLAKDTLAYHTPDHFCEQCGYDQCSDGNSDPSTYLDCVSTACGDDCYAQAADRVDAGEGCMAQCEEMWESCLTSSEDSGGEIDDYCVEMARSCYSDCQEDTSSGFFDNAHEKFP